MVQKKVSDILKTRVLVGHALHNDLQVSLSYTFTCAIIRLLETDLLG